MTDRTGECPTCGRIAEDTWCAEGHERTPRVPLSTVRRVEAALQPLRRIADGMD
jgi:hypothetical protein